MRKWMLAALAGAFAVSLSSGVGSWIDALSGAFVPQDIAQDVAAARLFDTEVSPYGPIVREMHSQVVPVPVDKTFPYFPHPPFSLLVSWPLAHVTFQTAALIWFGVTFALVFVLASLLAETYGDNSRATSATWVFGLFGALLCWPPVLYNLEKGQWSVLLAVLVGLGWRSLSRSEHGRAGVWIGAAAAVKVFPVVLGAYLLMRSRRAVVGFMLTGLFLTALPLLRIGADAFPAFIGQSQMNLPYWETFPSVTFSIHGLLARLLIGGQWARPAAHAPTIARVLEVVVVAVLLGLVIRATLRSERLNTSPAMPFAAWVAMLPVLNPQSLGHNGVLLALPLVLTARALSDRRPCLKVAWTTSLMLVSIPRQTLWSLAPPPLEPWQGVAITALPMWGALLLFGIAIILVTPIPQPLESLRTTPPNLIE